MLIQSGGKGKRVRSNEKVEEKLKEVVHVRAKRGQATDSHSLAERVNSINKFVLYIMKKPILILVRFLNQPISCKTGKKRKDQ